MKNADYRKHNDGSMNSSKYHKKDGTNIRAILKVETAKEIDDYGCDPLGDGTFRMVPSGRIVSAEEKEALLKPTRPAPRNNDCLGMSWEEIERKQGGKLKK